MRKTELLIPAGSLDVLKTAVIYGADAVYLGGEAFGLRAKAKNFTNDEIKEGIAFAHEHGVKVYITANILAHNDDLPGVEEYFKELEEIRPDALIISDPGVFAIAKRVLPDMELHISTQANNTNYGTYLFWHELGAKRVVSARELSLKEIREIRETFATPRRTEVLTEALTGIDIEDLIPDEEVVITLSRRGYMKRTNLENYQQQKRGGKGIAALHTSDDDYVQEFLTTTNHQYLCLFTNKGRMHQLKVHQVPEGSRTAKGVHINNLLPLEEGEWVTTVLALREFAEDKYFLFVTRRGMVKRSSASLYARCRKTGLMAVGLREDDELVVVRPIREDNHIVLATADGFAIRFSCGDIRPMGRVATGVKGIALRRQDSVVAGVILKDVDQTTEIMSISANGYGKRTRVDLYRLQSRGGKGIINFKVTGKTGPVVGAMPVRDNDGLILLTSSNKIVRIGVDEVRSKGRATMGVMLVRLDEGGRVVGFDRVDEGGQTGRDLSVELDAEGDAPSAVVSGPDSANSASSADETDQDGDA